MNVGLEQPTRPIELRDWAKSIGLSPLEDYLIDPRVQQLTLGLGWDQGVDVDASAALFNSQRVSLDFVWWHQLHNANQSVRHSGDDRTGEGEGDDEQIQIDLERLPLEVHYILLAVCIYTEGVSFNQVHHAYVRLIHGKEKFNNHVLCSFSLSELRGNAMLMGVLTRKGAYWNFRALGMPAMGRTILQLVNFPQNLECLKETESFAPIRRHVRVRVIKGEGLAAKDAGGMFGRPPSSDPYYTIKFKKGCERSKYIRRTLDPVWPVLIFDLGWITESESKGLKIEVFDYDALSKDDFMGCVWIPGSALFNQGVGTQVLWFTLGPSKEEDYRREAVSGRIQLEINVLE